ncbi:hypothetical protein NL676_025802 [Syzygium grande]|nr:hypothetical protein NL676_025802 [Syzygium grande]
MNTNTIFFADLNVEHDPLSITSSTAQHSHAAAVGPPLDELNTRLPCSSNLWPSRSRQAQRPWAEPPDLSELCNSSMAVELSTIESETTRSAQIRHMQFNFGGGKDPLLEPDNAKHIQFRSDSACLRNRALRHMPKSTHIQIAIADPLLLEPYRAKQQLQATRTSTFSSAFRVREEKPRARSETE